MNEYQITIYPKGTRWPDMESILEHLGNVVIRHDHESVWVNPSDVDSVVCILNDMGYETDEDILEPEIFIDASSLGDATEEQAKQMCWLLYERGWTVYYGNPVNTHWDPRDPLYEIFERDWNECLDIISKQEN